MSLFYRYDKEGPGVPEHEKPKKTFFFFFEVLFKYFWQLMTVNFIYWLLLLFPVGVSSIGMTAVTRSLSRRKHSFMVSDFFTAFKKNVKQSVAVGLINSIVTVLAVLSLRFYAYQVFSAEETNYLSMFYLAVVSVFLLIFISMKFYIWFLVLTFDLPIGKIYKNSFMLVAANLKNNLFILLTLFAFFIVCGAIYAFVPGYFGIGLAAILILFVYPGYRYLAIQLGVFGCIKKTMIDPYYEQHPEADIEKRKALGIYDTEE